MSGDDGSAGSADNGASEKSSTCPLPSATRSFSSDEAATFGNSVTRARDERGPIGDNTVTWEQNIVI
jgi:hypothetical protein